MKNEEKRYMKSLRVGDEVAFKKIFYLYSERLFA